MLCMPCRSTLCIMCELSRHAATGAYPCCGALCQKRQPMRSQSGCTTQPHNPATPPSDPPQAFAQRPALDETHGQARIVHLLLQYQQLVVQQPSATVRHASQQSQGNNSDSRQQSETEEAAAHGYDAVAVRAITAHLPLSIEKPPTKSCMGSWPNEMPHKITVQSVSPSLTCMQCWAC